MKEKNILISGASGFVGTNLINLNKDFTFLSIDLRKSIDLLNFKSELGIIHCAGIAHDINNKYSYDDYYKINTELTISLFNKFLKSDIEVFIFLSSIKAVTDGDGIDINENFKPQPGTFYGQSKLAAESYILDKISNSNKRIYILRPTLIYGTKIKGNLELLFKYINSGFPWLFESFKNQRSYCNIENLNFVITNLMTNNNIPSGVYNICDNDSISTNDLVSFISYSLDKKIIKIKIPKSIIYLFSYVGDFFHLPFNSKALKKLTTNLTVDNSKIKSFLSYDLPFSIKDSFLREKNIK